MPGPINTGNFAKAMWPGVADWWGVSYNEFPKFTGDMFYVTSSEKLYEELVGFSGLGLFREKPEGQGIAYDSMQQGYVTRVYNKTYALGYQVTEEMIEDNQYPSQLNALGKDAGRVLGRSAAETEEVLAANFYNLAFSTSQTFGDAKALCVSDHPTVKGSTFSNVPAVSADLSEVALEQASIDIKRFKNDAGLRINLVGQALIVPPELEFEAARILKSTLQNDTANNAINALKASGAFPKGVVVNPYLTDSKAWFIRTNIMDGKGLVCFERIKPEVKMDNSFDTGNAKFKCRFRKSFTNGDPRSIYGSAGA